MNKKRILMLGPSLETKGGISAVAKAYMDSNLTREFHIKYISTHIDGTKIKKACVFTSAAIKFFILCLDLKRRIVHIHISSYFSFYRKFIIFIIAGCFKKKIIAHIHGAEFKKFHDSHGTHAFFIRYMFDRVDLIIVLSDKQRKEYIFWTVNKNIVVLYNPVDTALYSHIKPWENSGEVKTILFMGNIGFRKGVYDIIKASTRVLKRCPDARFILAGDGESRKALELCEKYGVVSNFEIPGWVRDDKKMDYYNKACIYLLPSYSEAMPVSLLEALASGLPIVSTTIAGIPDVVQDGINGYLIRPGDIDAMVDKISALLNSVNLRQAMGIANKQKAVELFDINVCIKKLCQIYEERSNK